MISLQAFLWSLGVCIAIISGLSAFIINYVLNKHSEEVRNLKEKVEVHEIEMNKIRLNYIDRFAIVNDNIGKTRHDIVNMLHGLALTIMELKTREDENQGN